MLTQAPEHEVVGAAHEAVQMPAWQVKPARHATPQPPQFAASLCVSTHAPPQVERGAAQSDWHAPPTQRCPVAQA
ncbi:MAG: hypothetical protein R3A52_13735 [Polyangiales bacterium]